MQTRRALIAALLFLLAGASGVAVVRSAERLRDAREREAASNLAAASAFALEQQLGQSLSATFALAALVRHRGEIEEFDAIAAEMVRFYGGLATLQLAPGGVIKRIYPLAGNEAAIGHNLLTDPDRRFQALTAMKTRELTIAGPFELRQGGVGLVARLAVFRGDEAGTESFWGFVTVVIRLRELLEAARLERLRAAGYAYELTRGDAVPGELSSMATSGPTPLRDPVTKVVHIASGQWTLAVVPVAGWGGRGVVVALEYGIAITGALGLAALAWVLLGQRERLRREVAARTEELASANAQLERDACERIAAQAAARAAEEQLRHAQKMEAVGQLAGGVAHDFNNALTGILAHAQLLSEELPEGTPARESADTIHEAALRAAELTKQLLGFARRGKVLSAPCDVNVVVRDVARLLSRTLAPSVRVVERLDASPATVIGDAAQLQHAVLNLAVNARDAMPSGGELRLTTRNFVPDAGWRVAHPGAGDGPHVALTVADTGHGIPAAIRERIFEPFFTTKASGRGTGMGLAMVYGTVRNHGGQLDVASDEGRGTAFTIFLPLAAAVALTPSPARDVATTAPSSGTVLVVDDDELPRGAAVRALQSAGFDVHATASGADAVSWFRAHAPQVSAVVLDLWMPGMDGSACFEALREIDPDVRVVLVSGFDRDGRAQHLLDAGARSFVAKPFTSGDLADAVRRAAREPV